MQTSLELEEQAAQLLAQAQKLRLQERAAVIKEIKTKVEQYGITAADLDLTRNRNTTGSPAPAKYRGPNGELWAGGRGRRPEWVHIALKAGKSLDEFLIKNH